MAEQLKLIYNQDFFEALIPNIQKTLPNVNSKDFLSLIYASNWEDLELKQRMRRISDVLGQYLNQDYSLGVKQLVEIYNHVSKSKMNTLGFEFMFFPDYIEVKGLENFEDSMFAMEEITKQVSCEFAIRPFFIKYPEQTLRQMMDWSKHSNAMVRRLSTEGARPRLPWAMALPRFKNNPKPILPILKRLRNDDSESVRRSVANNLNDISKDNPEAVYNLVKGWKGESKDVDWVVKHACRTMLKQGLPHIMTLFNYSPVEYLEVGDIQIKTPEVKIGEALHFEFQLKNNTEKIVKVRIEYGLYFKKANGTLVKKVFKISEKDYKPLETVLIDRKQSFKIISTRKLYTGDHGVALIVNGVEFKMQPFILKD